MSKKSLLVFGLLIAGTSVAIAQRSSKCFVNVGGGFYQPYMGVGGGTAWKKGSAVTLYIVSPTTGGFTSGQITDIETALSNWNTSAGSSLSITNSVVTTAPTSFPAQYILVKFGSTSGCGDGLAACTNYNYNTTTGYPTYSIINVSTSIGTGGIRPLMAHEMGHTYLMADCSESIGCTATLTLMDPNLNGSSPTSPLCCDLDLIYGVTPQPYDQQGVYCR